MSEPFYTEGLRFECTRCSACCRFQPGYVFLSQNDLSELAVFFGMTEDEFAGLYCRKVDVGGYKRLSLNEKKNNDCWFWEENGCKVYDVRPLQCRAFPFWFSTLSCREAWNNAARDCPGMNRGQLHSREEIESWLARRKEEPYIDGE